MEDSLIAAILALLIILVWRKGEEYTSFKSQIANLDVLNAHEVNIHFKDSDFNQMDSKLSPSVMFTGGPPTVNPVTGPTLTNGPALINTGPVIGPVAPPVAASISPAMTTAPSGAVLASAVPSAAVISSLHPAAAAAVIASLPPSTAAAVVASLPPATAAAVAATSPAALASLPPAAAAAAASPAALAALPPAAAAAVIAALPPAAAAAATASLPPPSTSSPKKGFVVGNDDPSWAAKVNALNCGWYYTWGASPPAGQGPNLPYFPMFWNVSKSKPTDLENIKKTYGTNPGILLGYNEPDGTDAAAQANMTVAAAVSYWPNLVATGMTLASPVMYGSLLDVPVQIMPTPQNPNPPPAQPNNPNPNGTYAAYPPPVTINIANAGKPANNVTLNPAIWLDSFLIQLSQTSNPVFPSIIAVHSYTPPDAPTFLATIDKIWAKYNLPIWVTEYSCADWKATCCNPSTVHINPTMFAYPTDQNISTNPTAQFMVQTVQGMNSRPYVQRYSWKERFLLAEPGSAPTGGYPITGTPDSIMSEKSIPNTNQGGPDYMNQSALFASYQHFPTSLPPLTPLGKLYASL